eukprot:9580195-Lingulodinium_polyedra.AAC.1
MSPELRAMWAEPQARYEGGKGQPGGKLQASIVRARHAIATPESQGCIEGPTMTVKKHQRGFIGVKGLFKEPPAE